MEGVASGSDWEKLVKRYIQEGTWPNYLNSSNVSHFFCWDFFHCKSNCKLSLLDMLHYVPTLNPAIKFFFSTSINLIKSFQMISMLFHYDELFVSTYIPKQ